MLTWGLGMPIPSDQLVTYLPWDVIMIIASVICAIACMQLAGGMDYLVHLAEKALRKNPGHITFAPVVTYLMTMLAGTGHTAFSTLPVIAEVAKGAGHSPLPSALHRGRCLPDCHHRLPISAAVVAFSGMLEPLGVDYLTLLAICIPSSFIACLLGAFIANLLGKPLDQDEVYLERKAKGLIKLRGTSQVEIKPYAKLSVGIFVASIVAVMAYATAISGNVGLISSPPIPAMAPSWASCSPPPP